MLGIGLESESTGVPSGPKESVGLGRWARLALLGLVVRPDKRDDPTPPPRLPISL